MYASARRFFARLASGSFKQPAKGHKSEGKYPRAIIDPQSSIIGLITTCRPAGNSGNRPRTNQTTRGYVEAIGRIKRSLDSAYRALSRYTGVSDAAALEEIRKFYADSFASVPRTESNGWRNLIATLGKSEAEMARLIDMSLLDELQREGFFERMDK